MLQIGKGAFRVSAVSSGDIALDASILNHAQHLLEHLSEVIVSGDVAR